MYAKARAYRNILNNLSEDFLPAMIFMLLVGVATLLARVHGLTANSRREQGFLHERAPKEGATL